MVIQKSTSPFTDFQAKRVFSPQPGSVTFLRANGKGVNTAKTFTRKMGGWEKTSYTSMYTFAPEMYACDGIDDFHALLAASVDSNRYVLNTCVPRPGLPTAAMRRTFKPTKTRTAEFVDHPDGVSFFTVDIDHWADHPKDFDPKSAFDWKTKIQDVARAWIRAHLPLWFWDASFVLQASSSAWTMGKVSMHLFFWLDRPIARDWLKKYTKHHIPSMDPTVFHPVQVIYYTSPKFFGGVDLKGRPIPEPDPLASVRCLLVRGQHDSVVTPDYWLGQPEHQKDRDAARAQAQAKLDKARERNKNDLKNISAVRERLMSDFRTSKYKPWEKVPLTELELKHQIANSYLDVCVNRIRHVDPSSGLHDAIATTTFAAIMMTRDYLDHDLIWDALFAPSVIALTRHPDRPRSEDEAQGEVSRLLEGAFDYVPDGSHPGLEGLEILRKRFFGGIGQSLIHVEPTKTEGTAGGVDAGVDSTASKEASDDLMADLIVSAEEIHRRLSHDWQIALADKRSGMSESFSSILQKGGKWGVRCPAGMGKSTQIAKSIYADRTKRNVSVNSPAVIALPAHATAAEAAQNMSDAGLEVFLDPSRTDKTCEDIENVVAFGKLLPQGGKLYCMTCHQHPKNSGSTDACPFWRETTRHAKCDVHIRTHTALVNKYAHYFDESPDEWDTGFKISSVGAKELPDYVQHATIEVRKTRKGITLNVVQDLSPTAGKAPNRPPPMKLDYTPQLTEESKKNIIKMIADTLRVEPHRNFIIEKVKGASNHNVFFAWRDMAQYAADEFTERFYVRANEVTQGFRPGLHITIAPDVLGLHTHESTPLPALELKDTYPVTVESKARLVEWIFKEVGVSTMQDLEAWARQNITHYPIDTLVIDESILGQLQYGGTLTIQQLEQLVKAEEVGGEGIGKLIGLMMDMKNKEGLGTYHKQIFSQTISEYVDCDSITVLKVHEQAMKRLHRGLKEKDLEKRKALLDETWNWQAVMALHFAIHHDWLGARIDEHGLHVYGIRKLDLRAARCAIYLDATMTPQTMRLIMGDDAEFIDVGIEQNPNLKVVHIPIDTSPSSNIWGDANGPATHRGYAQILAIFANYLEEDKKMFLLVHLKHTSPSKSWFANLLQYIKEEGYGDYTHNFSDVSRGSNKYQDFPSAFLTQIYAPKAAKVVLTELMMVASGDMNQEHRDEWAAEAAWSIEGAQMVQQVARIRPLSATIEKPKTIIFATKTQPEDLGYVTTAWVNPDLLAYETFGYMPSLSPEDTRVDGSPSRDTMKVIMHDMLAANGGVVHLGKESSTWPTVMPCKPAWDKQMKSMTGRIPKPIQSTATTTASSRIQSWTDHFGNRAALARATDAFITEVRIPGSSHRVQFLHINATPPMGLIRLSLVQMGHAEFIDPTTNALVVINPENSREGKIKQALSSISTQALTNRRMSELLDEIGAHPAIGVSGRHMASWLAELRAPGEDNRQVLIRLSAEVHSAMVTTDREQMKAALVERGCCTSEDADVFLDESVRVQGCGCAVGEVSLLAMSIILEHADDPNGIILTGRPYIPAGTIFVEPVSPAVADADDEWPSNKDPVSTGDNLPTADLDTDDGWMTVSDTDAAWAFQWA